MTENQKRGIAKFSANPYWRGKYDNAPSDAAKSYYAESFAYGCNLSKGQEHADILIEIYKNLSRQDWDYIIENCHSNMGRWAIKKAREKYESPVA